MKKSNFLQQLVEQLTSALPEHMNQCKTDFKKSCERILQTTFNQFNLVTREEFDTQTKVLARTRSKITALEKQVSELENLLKKTKQQDDTTGTTK